MRRPHPTFPPRTVEPRLLSVPRDIEKAADCGLTCLEWGGSFELAGKRVGVVHGHLSSDLRRVLSDRPDYLLSGHSHLAHDIREGSVRKINPGALYRAREFSVALLDLKTDVLQFLPVPR